MFLRLSQIRFARVGKWNKSYDRVRVFESNVLFTVLFHAFPLLPPHSSTLKEDCSLAEKIYKKKHNFLVDSFDGIDSIPYARSWK